MTEAAGEKELSYRLVGFPLVLATVLLILFATGNSAAQRVTGQSAAEAYSAGNFRKSYEEYSQLLESFPRDPVYLYGAGASLVNLGINPADAVLLLQKSMASGSAIRSVPPDAGFYLARAYHLAGRYADAAAGYERYSVAVGRRMAREMGIPDYLKQCSEGTGALPPGDEIIPPVTEPARTEPVKTETDKKETDKKDPDKTESHKAEPDTSAVAVELIDEKADSLLYAAIQHMKGSDSLMARIAILEERMTGAPAAERSALGREIGELRLRVASGQEVSDSLLSGSGLKVQESIKADTIAAVVQPAREADTVVAGRLPTVKPVTSLFEVKEKGFYSAENPVSVSDRFPAGLYYTIQMAVFRNPVAPSHFGRLYPVFGIRNKGSDLTFYYAGLFRRGDDASRALPHVRNEGFRDAFVAIFMDGKQVSAERGALLEKEWGQKGLDEWKGVVESLVAVPAEADTVPPTLLFRVELMRSVKPVTGEKMAEMEKISSGRGLEIMNPAAGIYVYLVGKFLTFETASSYADLLRRNGYGEARVAAYLGNREIPVETALKFFEK